MLFVKREVLLPLFFSSDLASELGYESQPKDKMTVISEGYRKVCTINEVREKGGKKPVIINGVEGGILVVEPEEGGKVYACDVYSTAYKYPLMDGEVRKDSNYGDRWVIESPLDGTIYDLSSGKVLKWCPGDTAGRKLLGMLKRDVKPTDLQTYRATVEDKQVFVKLSD